MYLAFHSYFISPCSSIKKGWLSWAFGSLLVTPLCFPSRQQSLGSAQGGLGDEWTASGCTAHCKGEIQGSGSPPSSVGCVWQKNQRVTQGREITSEGVSGMSLRTLGAGALYWALEGQAGGWRGCCGRAARPLTGSRQGRAMWSLATERFLITHLFKLVHPQGTRVVIWLFNKTSRYFLQCLLFCSLIGESRNLNHLWACLNCI